MSDCTCKILICQLECVELSNPENGSVTVNSDGTLAVYTCAIGFLLEGSRERECVDGIWTGIDVQCRQQGILCFEKLTLAHCMLTVNICCECLNAKT